jgi:hypothetical protein
MNDLEMIKSQFNNRVAFSEKRPGIFQLVAPFYHEDGDMIEIFLEKSPENRGMKRICDHGMTLMRLSYSYELDTPRKQEIFRRILSENLVSENAGNLYIDVEPERLYPAILQFAQVVAKVSNMRLYKREVIHSLFFEMIEEIMETQLRGFDPRKSYFPIPEHDEYEVDWCINSRAKPLFVFGVNGTARARLATLSCQKFLLEEIKFRSIMILESLDVIGKKDQARLMSVADKQFPSLEDFKENAEKYLERELA